MSRVTTPLPVILAHHPTLEGKLLLDALRAEAGFTFEPCNPEAVDILLALRQLAAEVILVANPGTCEAICGIVRSVHRKHPHCKQVILLSEWQKSAIPELFRSGARGVVDVQTAEIKMLCGCIAHVHEGHFWLSSSQLDSVLQQFSTSRSLQLVNGHGKELLSRRERDVVTLLAEGLTNRDIARELGISPCTVRNYVSQIFDKVGVSTRTELAHFALAPERTTLERSQLRAEVKPTHASNSLRPARLKRAL